MMKVLYSVLVIYVLLGVTSFNVDAQGSCATAVPVTNLTGSPCATATPQLTNTLTPPVGCVNGTLDTWFSFVAQGGSATITVSNTVAAWRPEFVVISSSNNTCTGVLTAVQCVDQAGSYNSINATINGLVVGQTYWVVVSSNSDATTGTISTCINNPAVVLNCVDNDACLDATTLTLNAPVGTASSAPLCISDCNNGANIGLDFAGNGCEDMLNPTVWYEFTTSASTSSIDVNLTSSVWSNPEFTIYQGNACTSPWTIVECFEGSAGSAVVNNISLAANTTYVIAVSDATGDQGTFNLCIVQDPDNSACNTTDALTVTATSLGSPLAGPYLPGEQVTFCYTLTNWTQVNCNYIGAIVPTFGNCWAPSSFNAQGMPVIINTPLTAQGVIQPCPPGPPCAWSACAGTAAGSWNWFTAGSATYNVNGYYAAGTPMPAGWYFLSSYNPATGACTGDPTDPDNTYGDGNFPNCGTNTFDYSVCFTLTAGPSGNCGTGLTDCSVSIKTFADGEFGAWNNLGCTADIPSVFPASLNCCAAIVNASVDQTLCANQTIALNGSYSNTTGSVTVAWTASPSGALAGLSSTTSLTPTFTPPAGISGPVTFTLTITDGTCVKTDQVLITITPQNTITPGSNQTVCVNTALTNITMTTTGATGATVSGLPAGVTGVWSANTVTISGTPTASGTFNYTVTTTGGCPPATTTGTITVTPQNTITPGSNQTVCVNTALTNITMTTTGATGATVSGLPAGVTGVWSANTVTISGTPTASGTFNYTVTTTGGCPPATTTGTITVTPQNTITPGSNQTVCVNTALTNITMTTTGATGATVSGLPAGVTGVWSANTVTISGTPTASGTFNYTVTTTGGCPPATTTGTITVTPQNTITPGSNQTVCVNTALTNITMTTTGATGATVSGLPAGVTGVWSANTVTISGTPTASGTFNYTVTTTGGCPPATTTGTITVTPQNTITPGSNQTVCVNTALTNITMTTTGATGATVSGLPAGVTGVWSANTVTISGTPTASGTFNYTVTTTGGCPPATTTGTITVTPQNTITPGSNQTVCVNTALTNITMTTTGATGATVSGLPAGVTGVWSANTVTISGTPTASGTFNYTVTTTGGCPPATTTGTITVTPQNTITPGSNQTVCVNTALTNITMTTTGATGATVSGLPAGVTGVWSANTVTISGTPTASGTFNYTVTTTGGCPPATTTGTITVTPQNTITPGSNQTVCVNTALTNITMTTTGATGATVSGLPAGVTGVWSANTVTISGTPTASGTFNYTVTTTGGCPPATTTGTITVTPQNTITPGSNQTVCVNTALTNITMTTTGATGATVSGLPAGVTGVWSANTVTISGTPTASGTFNYTVTTTGGCPPATTTGTITVVANPVISLVPTNPLICNGTNGFITVSGTASGTLFWSGPTSGSQSVSSASATITGLGSGTYSVYFVNASGCTSNTSTTSLTNPNAPIINPISNVNNCSTSYSLPTISGTNLVSPQYYTLPGGPTGGGVIVPVGTTYTAPTNITLYAYDASGVCNNQQSFTIIIRSLPTVTSVTGGGSYCVGSPVSPILVSTTGTPNWSINYTLNGVAQSPITSSSTSISLGTTAGTYVVTGISDAYCSNSAIGTQTITINSLPSVTSINGGGTFCAGATISPVSVTVSGAPNYSIAYSINGIAQTAINSSSSPISLGTTPGIYTITGISDANCSNTATGSQTITINPLPTISSITGGAVYCAGSPVSPILVSTTGTPNWSINYTLNGVAQSPITSSSSSISLGTTAGTYVLTGISDAYCSNSAIGTQTITINSLPSVTSINGGGTFCAGATISPVSVTVSGAPNYSIAYSINGIAQTAINSSSSPISLGTTPGIYTITGISDANCSNTATGSQTITINPLPTISSITGGAVYCAGSAINPINVSLTGSPSWAISYTLNGIAQSPVSGSVSPISLGSLPGNYVVTGVSDLFCTNAVTGTQTITVNQPPTYSVVGNNPITCNGSDGSITISGLLNSTSYSIGYTDGSTVISPVTVTSSPTGTIIIGSLDAGTYTNFNVTLISSGCLTTNSSVINLVNPGSPVLNPYSNVTSCDTYTLPAINGVNLGTVGYWTQPNGTGTPLSPGSTISSSGSIYVYAQNGFCSDEEVFLVTIQQTPSILNPGNQTACESFNLPIIQGVNLSGNQAYYTNNPSTGGQLLNGPLTTNQTVWIYDVNSGCETTEFFTVVINPNPDLVSISGGGTYCEGDQVANVNIVVNGTSPYSLEYTLNGTPQSMTSVNSTFTLGNLPGTYVLTQLSDAACSTAVSGTETITIINLPDAPTPGSSETYCLNWVPAPMTATGSGGTLNWYLNPALSAITDNIPDVIEGITTYYVTETINGCEGPSASIQITFENCDITVPTAFTPDGDNINDFWELNDIDLVYPKNQVRVFNRWGNLLYESNEGNYSAEPWRGDFEGKPLPVGSYYFIIEFNDGASESKKGIVSIILK